MTENPLNELSRIEAGYGLLLTQICPDCGALPTVLSTIPGTDIPRSIEPPRHAANCSHVGESCDTI